MQYIIKAVVTLIIPVIMHSGMISMVSTTPQEAATVFLDGLKTQQSHVMEKYMDNAYVNFLNNVQGDEAVVQRMNDALFRNFTYKINKIAQKNDVAVAKVTITCNDFSTVIAEYNADSYSFVMGNLYTDEIADKEWLNAQCLEIYVQQIEKAADSGTVSEIVIFVPMVDDGYYGWNVIISDELMRSVLGNLEMPVTQ